MTTEVPIHIVCRTSTGERVKIRAIATIPADGWTPIRYPNALFDDDEQCWVSDAEVAEIDFTAFTGRRTSPPE